MILSLTICKIWFRYNLSMYSHKISIIGSRQIFLPKCTHWSGLIVLGLTVWKIWPRHKKAKGHPDKQMGKSFREWKLSCVSFHFSDSVVLGKRFKHPILFSRNLNYLSLERGHGFELTWFFFTNEYFEPCVIVINPIILEKSLPVPQMMHKFWS